MQYALLIYVDPESTNGRSDDEAQAITREYLDIRADPRMFGGAHLRDPETATTVRVVDAKPLITDGPFADTKEVFGGFYLLEADDLVLAHTGDEGTAFRLTLPVR